MGSGIFICYRREDSAGDARQLYDILKRQFGSSQVFIDIDKIEAGDRFDKVIQETLDKCGIFLLLIGPRWLVQMKQRAADHNEDQVLNEIEIALKKKLKIIPVRVGPEAWLHPMPTTSQLPTTISDITFYQKLDLRHEHFQSDSKALVRAIQPELVKSLRHRLWPWRHPYFVLAIVTASIIFFFWLIAHRSSTSNRNVEAQLSRCEKSDVEYHYSGGWHHNFFENTLKGDVSGFLAWRYIRWTTIGADGKPYSITMKIPEIGTAEDSLIVPGCNYAIKMTAALFNGQWTNTIFIKREPNLLKRP